MERPQRSTRSWTLLSLWSLPVVVKMDWRMAVSLLMSCLAFVAIAMVTVAERPT